MKNALSRLSPVSRLYLFLFCTLTGAFVSYVSLLMIDTRAVLGTYISQTNTSQTTQETKTEPTFAPPTQPPVQQIQPTTPPADRQAPTPTEAPRITEPPVQPPSDEISTGQERTDQPPVYVATKDEGELIDITNPSIDVQYQPTTTTVIVQAIEYASQATISLRPQTATSTTSITSVPGSSGQTSSGQQPVQTSPGSLQSVQSTDQIIISSPAIIRQVELADSSIAEIGDVLRPYQIAVKPSGVNTVAIARGTTTANTLLPVRVNINRTSVFVLTSDGRTNAIYYPDVIAEYALDTNLLTRHAPTSKEAEARLSFVNNDLVYDLHGCSQQYLFAFLPVCINRTVRISAKTKQIYGITHSRLDQILDIVSL